MEDFAQLAFEGYKTLNLIQSRIYNKAFYSNENVLVRHFDALAWLASRDHVGAPREYHEYGKGEVGTSSSNGNVLVRRYDASSPMWV